MKVAKLVPDKPLKPIDVSDNLGVRFDKYGNCLPYSILGNVEDYLKEAVANGRSIVFYAYFCFMMYNLKFWIRFN